METEVKHASVVRSPSIRLLQDPPLPGPTNMARDEALLICVGETTSPPTLRLYQWSEPTVSLGYFQRYADYQALPLPERDLGVVRRLTGGGAILHDREVTYSLTLPTDHALLTAGPSQLYELMHEAVIACASKMHVEAGIAGQGDESGPSHGPFFCFARRHRFDVLVGGQKLAGSAQRRTRRAVLQHGSIILASRYASQPTAALGLPYAKSVALVRDELPQAFALQTQSETITGTWSESESTLADGLTQKYTGDAWTKRR